MPVRRRYAALLRGINLGARNKLSMGDLRALVEALGGEDVQTYVQSGNVVLTSQLGSDDLERELSCRLRAEHGLEVPVLVRTKAELAKVVAGNPFVKAGKDAASLHVTFLADRPARPRVVQLDARSAGPDELRFTGREVYLHCPNGYGRSKLQNAFLEKQLGTLATTRNWRTVRALADLAAATGST